MHHHQLQHHSPAPALAALALTPAFALAGLAGLNVHTEDGGVPHGRRRHHAAGEDLHLLQAQHSQLRAALAAALAAAIVAALAIGAREQ